MAVSKVRVPGGGNTFVTISANGGNDTDIQLVSSFSDNPGTVNGGPVDIHPIGYEHPMEIVTGYSVGSGIIQLQVWAVWGKDGWAEPFAELWKAVNTSRAYVNSDNFDTDGKTPTNLMGVLQAQRANGSFTLKKWELAANGYDVARVRTYENCVITDIQAGETVQNDSMPQTINVTIRYTHSVVSRNAGRRRLNTR